MTAGAQLPVIPDTARVLNTASYRFVAEDGSPISGTAAADVLLRHRAGLTFTPPRAQAAPAGVRRVLAHVLTNSGTAADAFALTAAAPAGWTASFYMDVNANGALDAGESPVPTTIALAQNASVALLLVVDIPASATGGFVGALDLTATSMMDNTVRATLQDRLTIVQGASASGIALDKTVDRASAAAGDTLLYTIAYVNAGVAATSPATITDALPAGAHYVAGSLRSGGLALTDAVDADAGQVSVAGTETITVSVGAIPVSGGGVVTFRAVVGVDAAAGALSNVASLNDGTPLAASPPAITIVATAMLSVQKALAGLDSVGAGDLVTYRITYANASATVSARGVILVDTLPVGLQFVSADGAPSVSGQVVTWTIGTVGQTSVTLNLVVRAVRPSTGIVNLVALAATNASGTSAAAAALRVAGWAGNELALTKSAQVLDVAIGEPVPYTLVLRNRGTVPLAGFVIRDLLPAGMRFVPASLAGADSARANGQLLTIWVNATLVAAEERTVRYAAVLGSAGASRSLLNRAVAEAENGFVVSDTASAAVRVRAGYAMQGRTLLGKVYLDRNDNGVQDAGEEGVTGAQILTADGQLVTADKEGRYSLRDIAPGTHALRLDTLTAIPKGFGLARAAEEIVVVRTDGWTTPRADFRLVQRLGAAPSTTCPDSATVTQAGAAVRVAAAITAPRIAPLRAAADREADDRNAFISGPAVRIASPVDGAIIATNRVYVGVKGEPGTTVTLYEGKKQIAEATLRPDGVQDFIGVELAPGPHTLRARIVNSWKNERWDSVTVHRSGVPTALELVDAGSAGPLVLRMDADSVTRVRVRVLDAWKIPVATQPDISVDVAGVRLDGMDSDARSLGEQRRADANGIVTVALRAGTVVGEGRLTVRDGEKLVLRRALRVLPTVRALVATGTAQVGVGAATQSFGAVTARGSIGHETSLTMSYDSRRGNENDFFARGYDPLDEARYATYGDGSERLVLSGATQRFSARVERGLDWVELGDVIARPAVSEDALLAGYQRSLSGVSTRLSAGLLTFRGFGSMTSQALEQQQLRGDGGSGPYVFGAGARAGTDRVTIEVRARDNAARVISRETLTRFSDYEIDYATGAVLLRRPVPADDPYGNPVFVVAMLERETGGAQHFVGGGRLEANVGGTLRLREADSLVIGFTGVRDGGQAAATLPPESMAILGADVHLRAGALSLGGELLRTTTVDSVGSAARASLRWTLPDERASFGAHWMQVDGGMTGTLDPRLGAGLSELHFDAAFKLSDATRFQLAHDRQHFAQYGIDRQTTTGSAKTNVGGRAVTQELGLSTDVQGVGGTAASSLTGKTTVAVASRVDAWIEGTHALNPAPLNAAAPTLTARPDQMGVGVAYRIAQGLRLEATHRVATMPDTIAGESTRYAVTSVDLRTSTLFGGEAWGGVERAGSTRASHAAVLGWNQHLAVGGGWTVSTLYERRVGLSRAALVDPARALPFARTEGDRWSVGGGLEWLPTSDHSRFSLRGEARNGEGRRGSRFTLGGDAPLGADAALITLHDWSRYTVTTAGLAGQESRQDRSLLGMALRPVGGNALNVLGKLEWRRTLNPLSGAAGASTVLGTTGEDKRLLGAADAILSASALTEVAVRYAVRWSANDQLLSSTGAALGIRSQYLGARVEQGVTRDGVARLRLDARMMLEQSSGTAPWSVAPSLAVRVGPRLELEGGYRMGDLLDRDFAANGGSGLFATIGVRFTEKLISSPAAFWRERIAGDR